MLSSVLWRRELPSEVVWDGGLEAVAAAAWGGATAAGCGLSAFLLAGDVVGGGSSEPFSARRLAADTLCERLVRGPRAGLGGATSAACDAAALAGDALAGRRAAFTARRLAAERLRERLVCGLGVGLGGGEARRGGGLRS
jgi:hypothetical protein